MPHAQSQALWEEFRGLCNGVFERRQQAFAQQAATFEQAKAQAVALCAQVEQSNEAAPTDRRSAEAQLQAWRDAFDAIGELPYADGGALRDRFQRATARHEQRLAGQDQRDAEAAESNVHVAARHVRAFQRAVSQGAPDDERAALRDAAEAFIAGVPRWPGKAAQQAVRQALARSDSVAPAADGDAARERALRQLCVRAEIFSSTATPPADATLRRDCEMQLLRQGLGQARQIEARDWEAMRLEWLAIDAVAPALHDELEHRFLQCLGKGRARPAAEAPAPMRGGRDRDRDRGDRRDRRDFDRRR